MKSFIDTIQYFLFIFVKAPLYLKAMLIVFFITSLSMIIAIINAAIFNCIVIPQIEKKTGRRLDFSLPWYNYSPYGSTIYYHVEIVRYVVKKYWALKFQHNESNALISNDYALQKINYKVADAPRFVIFMCLFAKANYI